MSDRIRMRCLRHGESLNVIAGIAGVVPSAPLTERGRHQPGAAAWATSAYLHRRGDATDSTVACFTV
jgi:hypothetical protein